MKSFFTTTVVLLLILLFTYAAVSKLLDYENFKMQLGQSPLLSAFASTIAWLVPAVEIAISLLLIFPKYRFTGLILSYSLMTMFTAYIYIILNYSAFVPCSCGGILEKLGWKEHLLFNIGFSLLSATAAILENNKKYKCHYNKSLIP